MGYADHGVRDRAGQGEPRDSELHAPEMGEAPGEVGAHLVAGADGALRRRRKFDSAGQ